MPSPNQFHPEFGYVYPTSRFRRTLRVSLVAAVIGAAAGGIGVLAMADRADRMRSEMRSEIASTIGLGESAVAAPVARPPAAAVPCPAQTGYSRDMKCPPPDTARSAALPSPAASASAGTDAAGVAEAPGDLAAAKPATSHAKKNRKPVQRREPQLTRQEAARNGYATPYGPYGDRGYGLAPYGLHYEQRREGRGVFW
jgi:hypothetical protein